MIARAVVAVVAILAGAALAAKLIDVLASENRRALDGLIARTPRDFGVLTQQHDHAEAVPGPIERTFNDLMRGTGMDEHLANLRGEEAPANPHGL